MTAASEPSLAALSPKEDPETLVLRGRPVRAIRFRRGVIVGLAALTSVSVVATAWIALRPTAFHVAGPADDRSEPGAVPRDALSGLPTGYGDVPKLGPPLPGDLGKPILDHQRELAGAGAAANAASVDEQTARAAAQARVAEAKAAAQSALLFKPTTTAPEPTAPVAPPPDPAPATPALDPARDPNAQLRKQAFVAAGDRRGPINPHSLIPPGSPHTLLAGSVIAASLVTGLRSDLPGLVIAQVSERIYDSVSGQILLIPQGARLLGSYDSVVAFGQRRALVVWQRIVFPDGSSLALDNVPATDPAGYAGLADKVDFHTWQLLKGAALSTLLGVGTGLSFSGESDLVQAIRESTQQNAARAGDQFVSRSLQIQPTITIRPGTPVRLVVHRDLVLTPWPN